MNRKLLFAVVALGAALAASAGMAAEAQWIWPVKQAQKEAPPGAVHFRKTFKLGQPESGRIEITCDNRYVLRLNGHLVGASNRWEQLDRYDVTALLVEGENAIDVRATNDDTAAGLAARVIVKAQGQDEQTFSTDKSWEARLNVGKSWNPEAINDVKPSEVFELGEFGKAGPWGTGVKPGEIVVAAARRPAAEGPFELRDGDRVVFLGNTFIERAQAYDFLETALTTRWPDRNVTFRNLGWSGDTVTGIARARFGTVEEGFRHLSEHVHATKPTVIFVCYGTNEAFEGEAGLDRFAADLEKLLEVLESTGARIVFIMPLPQEWVDPRLPDPAKYNDGLHDYRRIIENAAKEHGHLACELGGALDLAGWPLTNDLGTGEWPTLTDNGQHFTEYGYWRAGKALLEALEVAPEKPWELSFFKCKPGEKCEHGYLAEGATIKENVVIAPAKIEFTATDEQLPYPVVPAGNKPKSPDAIPQRLIKFDGLEPGKYALAIDGQVVHTADLKEWAAGVQLAAGPEFDQVEKLRQTIRAKNELYFHRWRPQNETYLYLFRKHEQGNNAREIPQFDPLVEAKEQEIARLRVPVPHKYTLTRVKE